MNMTTLNESSRRAFLAALGATGAAAAVVAAPGGTVHADPEAVGFSDPNSSALPTEALGTEAFPAPVPGVTYKFIPGADFFELDEANVYDKNFGQVQVAATSQAFIYSLADLPPGCIITEVTFAVIKTAALPGLAQYRAFHVTSGNIVNIGQADNAALPQQTAEQYVSIPIDTTDPVWTLDNQLASTVYLAPLMISSRVNSVRVGYVPGPTTPLSFVPIAPKRAYDSRFVAPLGPLPNNTNRVISVANSFVTGTGTLETSDIIPATARAIAYNLTIADTVGSGFLSVNPGNATAPGGSSINWFQSGMSLANGLVGSLDNSRQIKVFCGGGGTTDFIVDINGYYL
jgi:hypothetical protein